MRELESTVHQIRRDVLEFGEPILRRFEESSCAIEAPRVFEPSVQSRSLTLTFSGRFGSFWRVIRV